MALADFFNPKERDAIYQDAERKDTELRASRMLGAKIDDSGIMVISIIPGLIGES